jgi:hypothetical protein
LASGIERPKRLVTLRRDGDEFVVTFYPEDIVVFRHSEPQPLRKMCTFLRWRIVSDRSGSDDTTLAIFDGVFSASAGYPLIQA